MDRKSTNSFMSPVFASRLTNAGITVKATDIANIDRDLSVTFQNGPEECFPAKEWNGEGLVRCGHSWSCPATKQRSLAPNTLQVSTFLARKSPFLKMRGD